MSVARLVTKDRRLGYLKKPSVVTSGRHKKATASRLALEYLADGRLSQRPQRSIRWDKWTSATELKGVRRVNMACGDV